MATGTVDIYAFFVNGASRSTNMKRVKQDILNANRAWKGCITFKLKGIYFSKTNLIVHASSVSSNQVFKNKRLGAIIENGKKATGHKKGIYVVYIGGDFLVEGKGKRVIGVGGTELVQFDYGDKYELFGRILLTNKAAGRYTLAHELGHVLLKRFNASTGRFTHDDPSGPFIHPQTKKKDPAHNNDSRNLMFPISPEVNPILTRQQCRIARMSKFVRESNERFSDDDFKNIYYF